MKCQDYSSKLRRITTRKYDPELLELYRYKSLNYSSKVGICGNLISIKLICMVHKYTCKNTVVFQLFYTFYGEKRRKINQSCLVTMETYLP